METKESQAGFGSIAVIGIIGALLVSGGAFYLATNAGDEMDSESVALEMADKDMMPEDSEMMKDEKMMDADASGTMMKDDPRMDEMSAEELAADGGAAPLPPTSNEPVVEETLPVAGPGEFVSFTTLGDAQEMAETKKTVLFFHADWCPSCRSLENSITSQLDEIPGDVAIVKVDYDANTVLRQQYGVVRQHTLVVIDETGAEVKKLTGLTNTLEQVVSQL